MLRKKQQLHFPLKQGTCICRIYTGVLDKVCLLLVLLLLLLLSLNIQPLLLPVCSQLDAAEEICGGEGSSGPCGDGLTLKAHVGIYKTFAISNQPPTVGLYDSSCSTPLYTNPAAAAAAQGHEDAADTVSAYLATAAAHAAALTDANDGSSNSGGEAEGSRQQDVEALGAVSAQAGPYEPSASIIGGEAIILTGPIKVISAHGPHESQTDEAAAARYKTGMLEYVASFSGRPLSPAELQQLPEDTPRVNPDAYKLLLVADEASP